MKSAYKNKKHGTNRKQVSFGDIEIKCFDGNCLFSTVEKLEIEEPEEFKKICYEGELTETGYVYVYPHPERYVKTHKNTFQFFGFEKIIRKLDKYLKGNNEGLEEESPHEADFSDSDEEKSPQQKEFERYLEECQELLGGNDPGSAKNHSGFGLRENRKSFFDLTTLASDEEKFNEEDFNKNPPSIKKQSL